MNNDFESYSAIDAIASIMLFFVIAILIYLFNETKLKKIPNLFKIIISALVITTLFFVFVLIILK
jgi:glucan phosphoethanolaminetransferase (alkaline phosphatase superfamily)